MCGLLQEPRKEGLASPQKPVNRLSQVAPDDDAARAPRTVKACAELSGAEGTRLVFFTAGAQGVHQRDQVDDVQQGRRHD